MSVVCFPQPGKGKSRQILEAFAAGCGGWIGDPARDNAAGPVAFYGTVGIERHLTDAIAQGRDWYYIDNAYLDCARNVRYRVAKNEFQPARLLTPDYQACAALGAGAAISPWRTAGLHVVVTVQSPYMLKLTGAPQGALWLEAVMQQLAKTSDRKVVVRPWNPDKMKLAATLHQDLRNAHALITHTSAAANEALRAGVPVFVSGQCPATPLASGGLDKLETPRMPDGREAWIAGLAGAQWTLDEMRRGAAWRYLNQGEGA